MQRLGRIAAIGERAAATSRTAPWNSAFLPTKSVSEFTSTSAADVPLEARPIRPSAAMRSAFLAAFRMPFSRSQSAAASMSPLFSTSAFLASIMPAPVLSRSCFTSAAVISAMSCLLSVQLRAAGVEPRGAQVGSNCRRSGHAGDLCRPHGRDTIYCASAPVVAASAGSFTTAAAPRSSPEAIDESAMPSSTASAIRLQ